MGRYRYTRRIDASPDEVFRGFTDPELLADWMDAAAVTAATGPLGDAGTRYTLVIRGPWRFWTEVLRSEPGRAYEIGGTGPLGARYRMLATLSARPDAGTDLDLAMEWTVPLGPIGRWIDRRWIEPGPHTSGHREVDRLVTLVSR